jgi:hypothetical protein
MRKPWHDFWPGQPYALDTVVAACERRIADGGVIREERKQYLVNRLREHAPSSIVWSPFSSGWGASPFNPNCWLSVDGRPVLPDDIEVPELPDADD